MSYSSYIVENFIQNYKRYSKEEEEDFIQAIHDKELKNGLVLAKGRNFYKDKDDMINLEDLDEFFNALGIQDEDETMFLKYYLLKNAGSLEKVNINDF